MNYFDVALLVSLLIEIKWCQSKDEYIIISNPVAVNTTSYNNCLTLSQFAANYTNYLGNDTTLILQPGNFTLELPLKVSNVETFSIYQNSTSNDVVVCNQSGQLLFSDIQAVYISNLNFRGCFGNKIVHIKHLILINTSFVGETLFRRGTALKLIETEAVLTRCLFSTNAYGSYRPTLNIRTDNISAVEYSKKRVGGAIIVVHSNVTIVLSNFTNNRAQKGGAIYAENSSVIVNATTLKSNFATSSFSSNDSIWNATAAGGALYAINNCYIHIHSCTIERNVVYGSKSMLGGMIAIFQSSLYVTESILNRNKAQMGGVAFLLESSAVFASCELYSCSASKNSGKGGVLFALNSIVSIDSCNLTGNYASRGGVAYLSNSAAVIQQCYFRENLAFDNVGGGVIYSRVESNISLILCFFKSNTATIGAVMLISSTKYDTYSINVSNCYFLENHAGYYGGVLTFQTYKHNYYTARQQFLSLKNSWFEKNTAGVKGGVIYVENHNLIISDIENTYKNNRAMIGGVKHISCFKLESFGAYFNDNFGANSGIVLLFKTNIKYSGVTFHHNVGSGLIAVDSVITFNGKINFTANIIEGKPTAHSNELIQGGAIKVILSIITFDTTSTTLTNNGGHDGGGAISSINSYINVFSKLIISNNRAKIGGGLHLYQSELICKDQIIFIKNFANSTGGGLYSSMSFIHLSIKGSLLFQRNFAKHGGGIFLTRNSKISVDGIPYKTALRIILIHNIAAFYGGGIYVDDNFSCGAAAGGQKLECFFHADSSHAFIKYLIFNLNEAKEGGSDLYGGIIDRCYYSRFHTDKQNFWYLNIKDPSITVSSQPVRICFCKQNKTSCDFQPDPVNVIKGKDFSVELVAVDQVNNPLKSTIYAVTASNASGLDIGQQSQTAFEVCTNVTYKVYSKHSSEQLILYTDGPCKNANFSSRLVHINFLPCRCAIGFMRTPERETCKCVCHKKLDPYLKECNSSTNLLLRSTNTWMDTVTYKGNQGYLIYLHCPYDYCYTASTPVYINLNTSGGADAQCAFHRSGVLCGACKQNFSVALGSSRCLQCSNTWLVLFIPFCLTGIALVLSMLVLNMTISKGTINAIIFFSNIVIANRPILIPFNRYNILAMLVSWISLDLGIETCFINGLDTYGKMWLQFLFPVYIFGLVISIIVSSQYSQRLSNLLGERNPIATLVTLIWLSNAKLFRTILSAVSFTFLQYPDNTSVPLWLPDGNIHYLGGKHIPLFIAAILIFALAIAYVAVLLSWQWIIHLQKCKISCWTRNTRLVSFMDAHHAAYKGKHRYWLGLVLLISIVQYSISAFNVTGNPAVNLYAIIVLITILTVYKGSVSGVYRKWPLDVLETTLHLNLILFAASTLYIMHAGGNQIVLANASLSIFFLTFIIVIGYHLVLLVCGDTLSRLNGKVNLRKRRSISIEHYDQLIDDNFRDADSPQIDGDPDIQSNANYYEMSDQMIKPLTSAVIHSEVEISKR